MSKSEGKLDTLIELINSGDKEAIISALHSGIAFPAFRAIVQAGDEGLDDIEILDGIKLWENSQIKMLGIPIQSYAKATLFHLGNLQASEITDEEFMLAKAFSMYNL